REGLPYAVPAIFFENGPVLVGFEVSPLDTGTSQPAINVVLVYRVASGAERFWSLARLVEPDGDPLRPSGQLVQPSPNHVVDGDELILSRLALDFPDSPGMVAN